MPKIVCLDMITSCKTKKNKLVKFYFVLKALTITKKIQFKLLNKPFVLVQ
jgi:hypothetical protein